MDRFKKIENNLEEFNNKIKDAVAQKTGYELKDHEFKITNGTLYLKVSSVARNTIYIKREAILSLLSSSLGHSAPKEII